MLTYFLCWEKDLIFLKIKWSNIGMHYSLYIGEQIADSRLYEST
jgi:hypothetical protein